MPRLRKTKKDREESGSSRKKPITAQELMDAAVRLLDSQRSVSSLSLREIAREAGIAPNSFYRHFRDVDELAVALIDQAGRSLRGMIREARKRLEDGRGGVRMSVEVFMEQIDAEEKTLQILMREMSLGSPAFRQAVDRELQYFEDELRDELVRLAEASQRAIHEPRLVAKAITRLVFTLGATAMELSVDERKALVEDTVTMVRMILRGAAGMADKS